MAVCYFNSDYNQRYECSFNIEKDSANVSVRYDITDEIEAINGVKMIGTNNQYQSRDILVIDHDTKRSFIFKNTVYIGHTSVLGTPDSKVITKFYTHTYFYHSDYEKLSLLPNTPRVNKIRIYNVPSEFKTQRKMLNRGLVEAIFADKVLLVEGPSEGVLFGKILSEMNPFYEADGIYILPVGGFGFTPYYKILDALEIENIIKTDNDLRKVKGKEKYSVLGFSRLNNYIGKVILPNAPIDHTGVEARRKLYDENKETLDFIRKEYSLYLSRCSLEEDLDEVIHDKMIEYLPAADGDVIGYLQDAKNNHMVELAERLTKEDCMRILEHYNFACLKEVIE